jgi:hypothetical protein
MTPREEVIKKIVLDWVANAEDDFGAAETLLRSLGDLRCRKAGRALRP